MCSAVVIKDRWTVLLMTVSHSHPLKTATAPADINKIVSLIDILLFLSRVSILLLTRDIDIVILSVCLSVRDTLVLYENGLTYRHSFSTIR